MKLYNVFFPTPRIGLAYLICFSTLLSFFVSFNTENLATSRSIELRLLTLEGVILELLKILHIF